jgi:hypothetical protein
MHTTNLAKSQEEVDATLRGPAHRDNSIDLSGQSYCGRKTLRQGGIMDTPRWEYRIINIRSENYRIDPAKESELNALGEEGWELVAITAINYKTAATDHIGMVFKRTKS